MSGYHNHLVVANELAPRLSFAGTDCFELRLERYYRIMSRLISQPATAPARLNALSRRQAFRRIGAAFGAAAVPWLPKTRYRLATFAADVTPPLGHPCMGGGVAPVALI